MGSVVRSWLSSNRSLVTDIARFAREIPLFPIERSFDLAELNRLRKNCPARISWPVLFIKAYALVAERMPTLRQAYVAWPWAHVEVCSQSTAMLAVNRHYQGSDRVCFGRFMEPHQQSLLELQRQLDAYQTEPVEEIFRRQVRLSKLPAWARRLGLWIAMNLSGDRRTKRIGTFSLSTVASQGALNRFHPTITTTSLTYGPLDAAGKLLVTVISDHRLIDGMLAAQALNELEHALVTQLADELRTLGAVAAPARLAG